MQSLFDVSVDDQAWGSSLMRDKLSAARKSEEGWGKKKDSITN